MVPIALILAGHPTASSPRQLHGLAHGFVERPLAIHFFISWSFTPSMDGWAAWAWANREEPGGKRRTTAVSGRSAGSWDLPRPIGSPPNGSGASRQCLRTLERCAERRRRDRVGRLGGTWLSVGLSSCCAPSRPRTGDETHQNPAASAGSMACSGLNFHQLSFEFLTCALHYRLCRLCVQPCPSYLTNKSLVRALPRRFCVSLCSTYLIVESSTDVPGPLVDDRQDVFHPLA